MAKTYSWNQLQALDTCPNCRHPVKLHRSHADRESGPSPNDPYSSMECSVENCDCAFLPLTTKTGVVKGYEIYGRGRGSE